jgi:beta-N-acetylhexosaminidase
MPKAMILGCQGLQLLASEREFFEEYQPLGFILFARNCESPAQTKELVEQLKSCVDHEQPFVLIDQEGGRVARLKPPHWRKSPAMSAFWELSEEQAKKAIFANARLIAHELYELGINVNCAPVADLWIEGAHDIIGDRAFSKNLEHIGPRASQMAAGLLDGGVLPVLKHIPGHGRAMVDSHEDLPIVSEALETLEQTDFKPFHYLKDIPLGMTAHITYTALDNQVATLSSKTIDYIRDEIGFDGLLMSDDVSMKALKGDLGELSQAILDAGCDLVLHCNGKMEEMQAVASTADTLTSEAKRRYKKAVDQLSLHPITDLTLYETILNEVLGN